MSTQPRWLRMQRLARREAERHPLRYVLGVSAGICAAQGPSQFRPGFDCPRPMTCTLMAGHIGAHSNGEGAHWFETPEADA